jgi:hypothetical protein
VCARVVEKHADELTAGAIITAVLEGRLAGKRPRRYKQAGSAEFVQFKLCGSS